MTPPESPTYNLLMLSGDTSVAQGVDGAFYQMLARFSRYWRRIDILTPTAPDVAPCCIHDNVYVHPAPYHRLLQPWFIRRRGADLLTQRRYHLVTSHDFGFFYNGIGALWLLRGRDTPLVSEIHHVEGYPRAVTLREKLWRAAAMRYLPYIGKRAAAIRVVNNGDVPALLRQVGVPDNKILVRSSLYLDLDTLQPQENASKDYDVLFVGRLASNKGIPLLLDAMRAVVQTHPQANLGIRGNGALQDEVREFIETHGLHDNIQFVPRVDNSAAMAQLYNRARMLVCASTVEGNPRVTVEAMACGVPVISTPVGIMPELITHGENGYLFDWDADALAGHIRTLLDDPDQQQRIGEHGHQTVQQFDADTTIHAYATAYHALIQREN